MALALITPPTVEPVTIEELKGFLDVQHTDDDALISSLGIAAREYVETTIGAALATQTWELTAREWPGHVFPLPKPPLQAVVSVKHRANDGSVVTLTADTHYRVDIAGGAIEAGAMGWPGVGDYADAVQVRFTCGYASAGAMPHRAKLAIMSLCKYWYDVREPAQPNDGATRRTPYHVRTMLAQLRAGRLEAVA